MLTRSVTPTLVRLIGVGTVALFLIVPAMSDRSVYYGRTIEAVRFYGLQNVSAGELMPVLTMQRGVTLEEGMLNDDVRALYDTGDFSNVILRLQPIADNRIIVNFEVTELPRIRRIRFLGADQLYENDLKGVLNFREGDVYNAQLARDGVQRIKRRYREEGYFLAEVWIRSEDIDEERNRITVTYVIDEGENIPISRINIIGLKNLNAEDIMNILEQKEKGFLEDGVFREAKFEEDKFRILAYARSNGYLDAEIDPDRTGYEIRWRNPRNPEDGRVVVVTYSIDEGDIRFFGGYSLDHDFDAINEELNPPERVIEGPDDLRPVYQSEDILQTLEYSDVNTGDVFDEGRFFRDRETIQELYRQRGYVFAQVQPVFINVSLDDQTLDRYEGCLAVENPQGFAAQRCKEEAERLDLEALRDALDNNPEMTGNIVRHVHFNVSENNIAYIENIIIKGMVKTQEQVIRRELLVKEGQLFNSALVNRSRERIFNLGFFEEVNLQMRPGSDDEKMNLVIDVVEQPTGTVSMGGGYGTSSGFSIFTEVGENNLAGTGQRISGRLQYGPTLQQVSLSWTDPWIYERCLDNTGNYWRNKQRQFDEAGNLEDIQAIAGEFENQYEHYGIRINELVEEMEGNQSIEAMDLVKSRIRQLIRPHVRAEENCFRSSPRPWSLSLYAGYASEEIETVSIRISDDETDFFEGARYTVTSVSLGVGVSHTFWLNWAHYHRYSPSWSQATRPSALVNNEVLRRTNLGWQFKSSLTHGLIYDNRDNVFNPTRGTNLDMSIETVGQMLGGQDHFNQYTISLKHYWWWFDYTFGGTFRNRNLRRWRVVQEARFTAMFTHETAPYNRSQNKEINPYLEPKDRLYIGGYESLRGYDFRSDQNYPGPWWQFGGANHMLLASTELRFPIEPNILWFAAFFDAGSMFLNLGELNQDSQEFVSNYRQSVQAARGADDPLEAYILDTVNPFTLQPYPFNSLTDWNDPRRAVLSQRNVALDRSLYSWGFGLRIQIPVLPLRLFLAQKLYYAGGGSFRPIPGDDKFEFVFGIGDFRF